MSPRSSRPRSDREHARASRALLGAWGVFTGVLFMMLGNGMLGTLIGVRAEIEGFPTAVTGIVQAAYFTGFLFGAWAVPYLVVAVGHVRVYAALASLASTAALVYAPWVNPWSWWFIRVLTGFAMSGLYIVVESWLNEASTNQTRGRMLAAYMVVVMGGVAGGQLLLNVGDPGGFGPFVLASVLVSLAVIPVTLSASRAPDFTLTTSLPFRRIWHAAPLGVVGGFGNGVAAGAFLGLGAVYGSRVGMSVSRIALFMAIAVAGTVALQWPIGVLSDRIDRRRSILAVTIAAGLAAVVALFVDPLGTTMLVAIFFVGGLMFALYALNMSHINDEVPPGTAVAVSSLYVSVNGLGAIFGPIAGAVAIQALGPNGLLWTILAVQVAICAFAVSRPRGRRRGPVRGRSRHMTIPARSGALVVRLARRVREE